jgi:hypothetical protein
MVGIVKPINKIVISGEPDIDEYKDGSSGAILPGDLCYLSGTNTIDEGGAATGSTNMAVGIVSYEHANTLYQPATQATAYASGTPAIPVIRLKSGLRVLARVAANLPVGTPLTGSGAGTGEFAAATIGTNHVYAVLLEATGDSDQLAAIQIL